MSGRRSRDPGRGRRLAAAVIAAGVALVAADMALRLLLGERLFNRPDDALLERRPDLPLLHRYRPHGEFHRSSVGDLAAMAGGSLASEPRHIDFRADARGFRNPPGASIGAASLLVLGDSFSVGTGSSEGLSWAACLARDTGLELYNLATPSTPWQEYVTLAVELAREAPLPGTLLLWQLFPANDLDDPVWGDTLEIAELPWRSAPGRAQIEVSTFLRRSPLLRLGRGITADRAPSDLVVERPFLDGRPLLFHRLYAERVRRDEAAIRASPNFAMLARTVGAMRRLAAEHRLVLKILLVPAKEEIYSWVLDGSEPWTGPEDPSGFGRAFAEIATAEEIPLLDLEPAMRRRARSLWEENKELLYWRDDTHWNTRGHAEAAALVAGELVPR